MKWIANIKYFTFNVHLVHRTRGNKILFFKLPKFRVLNKSLIFVYSIVQPASSHDSASSKPVGPIHLNMQVHYLTTSDPFGLVGLSYLGPAQPFHFNPI